MNAGSLPRTFFDTNIFVYTDDARSPEKQSEARKLVRRYGDASAAVISLQVMQEYFWTVTGKLKLDAVFARRKVELMANLDVAVANADDVLAAIDLQRLHGFSFWDSLIFRMAKESGCRVLLTEDMQNLRELDGVKIVNPFL